MGRIAFELLKWLPVASVVVNVVIARSVAKEICETGKSSRSFLKLLVWFALVIVLYAIAMG